MSVVDEGRTTAREEWFRVGEGTADEVPRGKRVTVPGIAGWKFYYRSWLAGKCNWGAAIGAPRLIGDASRG